MSDKTEEPTPRRLRKAREDGDSAVSAALVQAAGFLVALAIAPAALYALAARSAELLRRAISGTPVSSPSIELAREVVTLSAPLVGAAAIATLAVGMIQTGGIVAFKKISPDMTKLNPISGFQALFKPERFLTLARALVAAIVIGWLAQKLLIANAPAIANSVGEPAAGAAAAGVLARRLGWIAALIGLGLAVVDLLIVRRSWLKRLRMSKDEVRREHRETEGDPEIKAARRRAHHEMLTSATISAVRDATVVVVNPTHLATALRYQEEEDEAPRVLAQGQGDLAQRMIAAAHAYGIPVVRDVPLARALQDLEVGAEIPEALYEAVAEILREAWAELEREKA